MKKFVLLLTGISGSGKSTIANELKKELGKRGVDTAIIDGDVSRDRIGNIIGHDENSRIKMANINKTIGMYLFENQINVIYAVVAPFESVRQVFRDCFKDNYIEVYVKASQDLCKKRDVKGMYKLAQSGKLDNFNGTNAVFEEPNYADVIIDTEQLTVEESVGGIVNYLEDNEYL